MPCWRDCAPPGDGLLVTPFFVMSTYVRLTTLRIAEWWSAASVVASLSMLAHAAATPMAALRAVSAARVASPSKWRVRMLQNLLRMLFARGPGNTMASSRASLTVMSLTGHLPFPGSFVRRVFPVSKRCGGRSFSVSVASVRPLPLMAMVKSTAQIIGGVSIVTRTSNGVPVRRGIDLLHSPEKWASRAGLLAGIGPFRVLDVRGAFTFGEECMVDGGTRGVTADYPLFGPRLRLTAREPESVTVTVTDAWDDHVCGVVHAHVNPLTGGDAGLMLVLDMEGDWDGEWDLDPVQLRETLRVGLWGCVDDQVPAHEALRLYREHLGILASEAE